MHSPTLRALVLGATLTLFASAADEKAPAFSEIRKIDVHSHVFEDLPQLNDWMREVNLRTVNICNRGTEGHVELMPRIAVDLYGKNPDLYPFLSTFDLLRRDEPGYLQEVIASLDRRFAQAAVGVKILNPFRCKSDFLSGAIP